MFEVSVYLRVAAAFVVFTGIAVGIFKTRRNRLNSESIHRGTINSFSIFFLTVLISLGFILPVTLVAGTALAKNDQSNYREWWNGLEKEALATETQCVRDGQCKHTFKCDPYEEIVMKTRSVPDGNGGYRTETYFETETHYHFCPFTTKEITYSVTDTLGETYVFGSHYFPPNPEAFRWTGTNSKSYFPSSVPSIEPIAWVAARDRLNARTPGGTSVQKIYKNWLQATQAEVFRKNASFIPEFTAQGLLPKVATEVTDLYHVQKAYFVGLTNVDMSRWNAEVQRFNGYFGTRQGDLHVVAVNADVVTDGSRYTAALEAFWQSEELGKNTLSKNGVVFVMGVKGDNVVWRSGFTGMPEGNERLVEKLKEVEITAFTPEDVLSLNSPFATLLFDPTDGFKRVQMKNYQYLEDKIVPSPLAYGIMISIASILFLITLGGLMYLNPSITVPTFVSNGSQRLNMRVSDRRKKVTEPERVAVQSEATPQDAPVGSYPQDAPVHRKVKKPKLTPQSSRK